MKVGSKIDDYQLLHLCGRGAFGTVFLAKDSKENYVALKVVSLTGEAGERELQALECYQKCCQHDCMLKITDVVMKEDSFFLYYVMEPADSLAEAESDAYVPFTLAELLKRKKTLTVLETTALIRQLLEVLAIIHSQKLVHRDIKPANIFWVNGQVKLGDIGLLANENSLTINAGSPGYMPPPDSGIDPNSTTVDLYALTRLIYVCLSGNPVSKMPDMNLTDDIFQHGHDLLSLMNLSNSELAGKTVQDFQRTLDHGKPGSALLFMPLFPSWFGKRSPAQILEELNVVLRKCTGATLISASDWLKKHNSDFSSADGSGISSAIVGGLTGLPGISAAAITVSLLQKFRKKEKM